MSEPEPNSTTSSEADHPKIFISYSHDSLEHMNRILELSNRLRAEGIDCQIDQYEDSPAEGWARWMINWVEDAKFVLVVATETYNSRFRGREKRGTGLGAKWEGAIITQDLYETEANNTKFIPVIFVSTDSVHIPIVLRSATYYDVGTESGYEELYRRLTNQRRISKPVIGKLRPMSALARKQSFEVTDRIPAWLRIFRELKRSWTRFWNLKPKAKVGLLGTCAGALLLFLIAGFAVLPEETREPLRIKLGLWPQPFRDKRWDYFDVTSNGEPNSVAWDYPKGQWRIESDSKDDPSSGVLVIYGSTWGLRNDLDSKAFYDFHVQFRVKFKQGSKAGWIFRAQDDKQSGFVFQLEKRDLSLFLNGWVYTNHGAPIPLDRTPDNYLKFVGPFINEDYFDIDADVNKDEFKYKVTFKSDKPMDDKGHFRDGVGRTDYVPPISGKGYYRFGNIGFYAPQGNQVIIANFILNP